MTYPLPAFHFAVEWGGSRIGFTEVSGLTQEIQAIEYREGVDTQYQARKMPGIPKFNNITLKRGIMALDDEFSDWIRTVNLNTVERRNIIISLLNEAHVPVMTWSVQAAFPVKVEGPSLKSTGNEVAMESIELAHEGFEVLAA